MNNSILYTAQSGRGLPQSKTWRKSVGHSWRVCVLECASPLALFLALPISSATAQSTNDIPPLQPALAEIPPTAWEQHGGLIIVLSSLGIVLLGVVIWWLLQPKPPIPVPIEIQTRNELELLRLPTEDGKTVSRVSQVLKHYFAVAFELPLGEMTTAEFQRVVAGSEKVGSALASSIGEFLRQCDERKFSPVAETQSPVCSRAMELVEQGERRRVELRQVAQPR